MDLTLVKQLLNFFSPNITEQDRMANLVVRSVTQFFATHHDTDDVYSIRLSSDSNDCKAHLSFETIPRHTITDSAYFLESKLIPLGYYCAQKKLRTGVVLYVVSEGTVK